EREKINAILQGIIDEQTAPWGIKVSIVEVKDVEIPQSMQRAMARQAEAERERRAKVINAEGEYQASERLKDAALVIERHRTARRRRASRSRTGRAAPTRRAGASASCRISFPRSSARRWSCTRRATFARSRSSPTTSSLRPQSHGPPAPRPHGPRDSTTSTPS